MRILVACEYSGRVREAFRKLGHDAWSCDLLPSDDNSPYHIQGDVLEKKLAELDQEWVTEMMKIYADSEEARWYA